MVVFNPQVGNLPNDNMPNFFKYSDSISQPKADESKGIALKTLGTGIEGGVALADTVVKDVIKTDAYNRVDTERDKFTTALSNASTYGNAEGPQPQQPDTGPNAPVNLMANTSTPVPTGISKGISAIARNEEGLKQDKVTQLEYIKNLNTIAKDMRATYPGYRDYVDAEISKITGMNPANAVIDSYISNINAAMATKNKEADYWRNAIVTSGYSGSDDVLREYERTGDHNKVMQFLAHNNGVRSDLALKTAQFNSQNQDDTTKVKNGTDLATAIAGQAATNYFYNKSQYGSANTPAEIADKLTDLALHPEKANDVAFQQISQEYAALHTNAYNQTMRLLTTPSKNPDGTYNKPVSQVIGMDGVKKIVDDSINNVFKTTRDLIADKQFGPAYYLQNTVTAITNGSAPYKVLTNPTIAGVAQTAAGFNKIAPNFVPFMTSQSLAAGVDKDIAGVTQEMKRQAIAQTGGKYFGADGNLYSFKQSLEEQAQVSNITGKPTPGAVIKDLVSVTQAITSDKSTPEARSNAVKYFYDSVNNGTMNKLMDDYYDPARGGMVAGRTSAFKTLTSDEVTKKLWDHGQEHPGDWAKYSNWAKAEASTQIKTVVSDLNRIQADFEHKSSTGLPGSQVKVAWDNERHIVKFLNHDGTPLDMLQSTISGSKLSNLNGYLTNLANIAKKEGSNIDAYVFKVLKDAGWSPTKEIDGVPAQLMRGMIISNGGKVNEKGPVGVTAPISRFAPEDVGGDLKSFLTNPGGSRQPSDASGTQSYQTRGVIKGNLSDETLLGIRTDEIPEGMSARDFIRQLKAGK